MTDLEWNQEVVKTFESDGWRLLEEQYTEQVETLKESLTKPENEAFHNVTRGRIQEIRFLLGYRKLVELNLETLNENA